MKTINYYILDVFAKNKYEGNQLAVYLDLEDKLTGEEMLQIAKEINFSESTFIKKKISKDQFEVKIYTPESEIPFAGHPTIGTSYIIAKYLMSETLDTLTLKLIQGDIYVSLSNKNDLDNCLFNMTQTQPVFLKTFRREEISKQLGLEAALIVENQPIQEISTGLPYIIIPIKDLESIEDINLNATSLKNFLIENGIHKSNSSSKLSTALFFFTDQSYEEGNDYNVRMFYLEEDTLKEDSATGSANGCFLAYLLKYISKEIKVETEQGFQMNRKSYLFLEGKLSEGRYDIKVGGYAKMVSKGEWIV